MLVGCRFVPVTGGLEIQFIFRGHNVVEKEIFSWIHMGSDIIPVKYMMIHHSGAEAVAGKLPAGKADIVYTIHANTCKYFKSNLQWEIVTPHSMICLAVLTTLSVALARETVTVIVIVLET